MNTCIKQNDMQPAFWNNLAVIQMHLGRFEDARRNARRALELLPNSAEIKKTLSQIDEAEKSKAAEAEKKDGKKASAPPKKGEGKASAPPKKDERKASAQSRPPADKRDAKKDARPARPAKGAKGGGKAKNVEGGK